MEEHPVFSLTWSNCSSWELPGAGEDACSNTLHQIRKIDILGKSDKSVHQLDVEKNIELDYPTYK
jgi:hypothetical protein